MRTKRIAFVAALLLLGACATGDEESIDAWQAGDFYFVTVGVSKLVMMMPKGDLLPHPASNESSRYSMFAARDDSLIVSGWFEPDRLFPGIDEYWKQKIASSRKAGIPAERDVQFSKLGNWQVITYEVEVPNVTSTHMLAHWVQSGTWIELHLSTTTTGLAADNRANLTEFLQGISVTERVF